MGGGAEKVKCSEVEERDEKEEDVAEELRKVEVEAGEEGEASAAEGDEGEAMVGHGLWQFTHRHASPQEFPWA